MIQAGFKPILFEPDEEEHKDFLMHANLEGKHYGILSVWEKA
jgi:hypothetical protein